MYTVLDGCLNLGTSVSFPVRNDRLNAENLEKRLELLRLFNRCKVRQTVKFIELDLFLNRALWAAHVKLSQVTNQRRRMHSWYYAVKQ